jgi:LuxR family maltose regulon positive regulatory protein
MTTAQPERRAAFGDLLSTKLMMPAGRTALVPRPRLIDRLQTGLRGPLTLLSAPAGSGKTTLLGAWRATPEGGSAPMAWVSLDPGDNDPARFWRYVFTALDSLRPGVATAALTMLQSPQPPPAEVALGSVLNALGTVVEDHILVLDDYHVIESHAVHQALAFLLDHLPPCLHLLLSGRADPPLPLARLRARGLLVEIRTDDLRCTPDEADRFLREVMGLDLSAEAVSALEARTEGWMAGLQLAALSLQGRQAEAIGPFIAAFSGSNRYLVDYLADEVLQRQPEPVQEFLVRTAVLDRLCAGLCDAVMAADGTGPSGGGPDSQAMLEHLERANLFVIALDDERRWYRYHHLFADVLRHRLSRTRGDDLPTLHRRAGAWYEAQGLAPEAIHHALAAHDDGWAASLIEQHGPSLGASGQVQTSLGWVRTLPEAVVRARPRLCYVTGGALLYTNQLEAASRWAEHAERALTGEVPTDERQTVLGLVAQLRSLIAVFSGDLARCVACAQQALELLPASEVLARAGATVMASHAFLVSGATTHDAEQTVARAIESARSGKNLFGALRAVMLLARLQAAQGRLHRAAATYEQAHEALPHADALQSWPSGPTYYIGTGDLLRERNDLGAAERLLRHGVDLLRGRLTIDAETVAQGYIGLARLLQARGEHDGALAALHQFAHLAARRRYAAHLIARGAAVQAQVRLAQGDMAAASRWAATSGLGGKDEVSYPRETEYLTLARVRIAETRAAHRPTGPVDETLQLLDHLLRAAEASERLGSAIEILILQALGHQAAGNGAAARTALEQALTLAGPEGYVRLFVDEGQPIATLLRQAQARGIAPDYVAILLTALGMPVQEGGLSTGPVRSLQAVGHLPAPRALAEPLSERERDVLRLLAAGLSNPEIARQLYVEASTIKTHVKSIYGKLGVHSREQAAARARELQLLPA